MQFRAVLNNAQHPEYGVTTVPFPIPTEQYDEIMDMLTRLEIGDPLKRDCRIDEVSDDWPILKRLQACDANVDELDFLAKRLDSYSVGEDAQFQGMATKLGISDMTDFINLTFCCQQATVITDFSDLNAVGKGHLLNLNGGGMPSEEYNRADGKMEALKLILNVDGTVTPYGVVYDNGMKLEQLYDGQHFPEYHYQPEVMTVEMKPRNAPDDSPGTFLFLPMTQTQIERAMLRAGIDNYVDMSLCFRESGLPDAIDAALDMEHESIGDLNKMCGAISTLSREETAKLGVVVSFAQPEYASQITHLAENLDLFDFAPGVQTPEDYGKYMIQESGHYDYDENLDDYYDYARYGSERMANEQGFFGDGGYIAYHGTLGIDELMMDEPTEQGLQMGGIE
jgi:hypothetical protein